MWTLELTGLDHIEEGGAKLGLLGLELFEHILGEVFLQEGLAVGGGLQLLEALIQLGNGSSVSHSCVLWRLLAVDKRK